jgi:hypothetical protein
MSFYKWLNEWAEQNKNRPDMWGAMAEYIDKAICDIQPEVKAFWTFARVLGFKEGTAECWMFAELYMKWEKDNVETGP